MGGFIRSDAERMEIAKLNTTIDKDIYEDFKDCCKVLGYPMNVMLETFMKQFVDGKFSIDFDKAKEWNKNTKNKVTLNTTVNLKAYKEFKSYCKQQIKLPVNAILTAFMKQFVDEEYVLEFKKVEK